MNTIERIKQKLGFWDKTLIVLVAFHGCCNIIWSILNNAPPSWDAAWHTLMSQDIFEHLQTGDIIGALHSSNYYPIFVHTLTAFLIFLIGPNIKLAQLVGTFFFLYLLIILYLYAKLITNSGKTAFLTVALFSFFPIVFDQSRRLMLDIPITSLVITNLYLLDRSENFTQRRLTFFYWISVGILLMTKWAGIVYISVPLALTIFQILRKENIISAAKNTVLALPWMLLIILPWYAINFESLKSLSKIYVVGYSDEPANLLSIQNFLYYLRLFINTQVTPLISIIVIIGSVYTAVHKRKYSSILTTIIVSYLFFSFIHNKDPRYTMPLLPLLSFLTSIFITDIITLYGNIGKKLVVFLSIYLLFYFFVLSFRPNFLNNVNFSFQLPLIGWINGIDISDKLAKTYHSESWPIDEILQQISQSQNKPSTKTIIGIEDEYFNPSTLQTYLKAQKLQGQLNNLSLDTPDITYLINRFKNDHFPTLNDLEAYLQSADFLIISPTTLGSEFLRNKIALNQIRYYALEEQLPSCDKFDRSVAPFKTSCIVKEGEILESNSDISLENKKLMQGIKTVQGYAIIDCPWGCSFKVLTPSSEKHTLQLIVLKQYQLPDSTPIVIYQIQPKRST